MAQEARSRRWVRTQAGMGTSLQPKEGTDNERQERPKSADPELRHRDRKMDQQGRPPPPYWKLKNQPETPSTAEMVTRSRKGGGEGEEKGKENERQ